VVSNAKLYSKLDLLEAELRERLIPLLEQAANGRNDGVFCVDRFSVSSKLKSKADPDMEALVHIGAQILVLREKLAEPTAGTLAERICWYCRQWSDANQNNRKNAQALAQQFLAELRETAI
tara:strand:+ start:189149 stop:189511 length:363 start_codon:yes stop_codon:yes gene_type:complete